MENSDKLICTKEELTWHYASMYLEGFRDTGVKYDEEFMRLFEQLREYVDGKLNSPYGGDIVEISVLVGRKFKV